MQGSLWGNRAWEVMASTTSYIQSTSNTSHIHGLDPPTRGVPGPSLGPQNISRILKGWRPRGSSVVQVGPSDAGTPPLWEMSTDPPTGTFLEERPLTHSGEPWCALTYVCMWCGRACICVCVHVFTCVSAHTCLHVFVCAHEYMWGQQGCHMGQGGGRVQGS